MAKESHLENLKKDYAKIQKKYNLPSFKEFDEEFHIEKAAEAETDLLITEIRRFMGDKLSNYLRFIEAILNPANAPMFVFSFIKSIGAEEKKKLAEIFKKLAKIEIKLIELDIEFSEKKEVEFIKESYKEWQDMKKELLNIINEVKKNWDTKSEANDKGYFG